MSATWVECLYCGHVLVCVEGQSAGDIRAAALIHDDACPNNPHVAKAKGLQAELDSACELIRQLTEALKPYATLAQLSAGKPSERPPT